MLPKRVPLCVPRVQVLPVRAPRSVQTHPRVAHRRPPSKCARQVEPFDQSSARMSWYAHALSHFSGCAFFFFQISPKSSKSVETSDLQPISTASPDPRFFSPACCVSPLSTYPRHRQSSGQHRLCHFFRSTFPFFFSSSFQLHSFLAAP